MLHTQFPLSPHLEDIAPSQETNHLYRPQTCMNQYLITFFYLFTVILLFLAFLICRVVPAGQPINIDLYCNNTILSFAIINPSLVSYIVLKGETQEQEKVDNSWGNQEGWGNEDSWDHADNWTPAENQLHISTPK